MARFAALAVCAAALLLAGVGSVITQSVYDTMLPNRDNSQCPASGFYTYDAFITAAAAFPSFGTTGSADDVKRELAAFFGQTSHETNGTSIGQRPEFKWGYCFKEEVSKATSPPYYGRGPIQLTGQSNYQQAGDFIGEDLVNNPDRVAQDAVISFKTAMWFWTTAQGNKPSCQDVALRRWTPTAADNAAGRVPGYGVITNIINGGRECGMGQKAENEDRIGYYKRYCGILGTDAGDNLDCYTQQNFAS
ncbi:chitinase 8-like [Lolium rigidum]|uniref:chitinase 8-like n=1 Tax=Lolium rigidum TaxID=89674 RepID=UPI001F5C656D|nr:chitinase 8-like [Lolium rigidum]